MSAACFPCAHTLYFFFCRIYFRFCVVSGICKLSPSLFICLSLSVYERVALFAFVLSLAPGPGPCRPRPLSTPRTHPLRVFSRFVFHSFYISCLVFFSISTHALFMLLSILCTHFKGGNSIPTHSVFPKKTRKPTRNFATRKLNHSSVKFTAKLHPGLINFRFELGNLSCLNSEEDEVEREEKKKNTVLFSLSFSLFCRSTRRIHNANLTKTAMWSAKRQRLHL